MVLLTDRESSNSDFLMLQTFKSPNYSFTYLITMTCHKMYVPYVKDGSSFSIRTILLCSYSVLIFYNTIRLPCLLSNPPSYRPLFLTLVRFSAQKSLVIKKSIQSCTTQGSGFRRQTKNLRTIYVIDQSIKTETSNRCFLNFNV